MKQNLIVALAVIVALVIADMLGAITLPTGVVGHEGSTLLVTLNGMRLLARPLGHLAAMATHRRPRWTPLR